jgi:hypothetical protein
MVANRRLVEARFLSAAAAKTDVGDTLPCKAAAESVRGHKADFGFNAQQAAHDTLAPMHWSFALPQN